MIEIQQLQLDPDVPGAPQDLTFQVGGLNVVLGPNRSGKTALCRLLTGLPGSASGRVLLDAVDISEQSPAQRPVALVNQAFVNYPHWTVARNIASPLLAQGVAADDCNRRVRAIAEQLQLAPLLERLPEQLSGGQQQRLAIGRALAKGARLLVMDEPLVNLDYKLREALELELAALLRAQGVTLIYTTTDPRDALLLADRVLVLDAHRLLQSGTVEAVYGSPETWRAAELMSDPALNRVDAHGVGVRPEHLHLRAPTDAHRSFDLTVSAVETNGSQTYLHGDYRSVEGAVYDWIAKLPGMHRFEPGVGVRLFARNLDLLTLPDVLVPPSQGTVKTTRAGVA